MFPQQHKSDVQQSEIDLFASDIDVVYIFTAGSLPLNTSDISSFPSAPGQSSPLGWGFNADNQ